MFLQRINILHYKNYSKASAVFQHKFNLVNGFNGSGKTNLIDVIHYLCLCKSYFTRSDADIVQHGETSFRLEGTFEVDGAQHEVVCKFYNPKKEFSRDGNVYERLSDHIGFVPVVMIAPDDIDIIHNGSEERRRFLDAAISQVNNEYLRHLMAYNKILLQRNTALKQTAGGGKLDHTLINVLNGQLAPHGNRLFAERQKFLSAFAPVFSAIYHRLSGEKEAAEVTYVSQLTEYDHLHLLMNSLRDDVEAQRTTTGIHKDDIRLMLSGFPVKETGSQGQIKSFLIALKLAQYKMMLELTGKKSILLLDDIFEKLDKRRLEVLFDILSTDDFDQIFITDADEYRSREFCEENLESFGHYYVQDNKIE